MLLWALYAGTAKQKHICGELVDRFSVKSGSLNTDAVFALIDLSNFLIRINNIRAFTHFISVSTSSFCLFSDITLYRVYKNVEVVFSIYGLGITIFWTFFKDFTDICIVYDVHIM